jgi:hypothetical protein
VSPRAPLCPKLFLSLWRTSWRFRFVLICSSSTESSTTRAADVRTASSRRSPSPLDEFVVSDQAPELAVFSRASSSASLSPEDTRTSPTITSRAQTSPVTRRKPS